MKIAFLCLAHNNFEYLSALSNYCSSDGDSFFLHIDKSKNIPSNLTMHNETILLDNEQRVASRWGTFSIVDATLNLLKSSVQKGEFDCFILISGADVPLVSKATLKSRLIKQKINMPIWNIVKQDEKKTSVHKEFFKRHNYYSKYTNWGEIFSANSRVRVYLGILLNLFIRCLPLPRSFSFESYAKGSQWWAIDSSMAEYFINLSSNVAVTRQFKYMHAPDEKFFHTLYLNSKYYNESSSTDQGGLLQGIHYIDWKMKNGKTAGMNYFELDMINMAANKGALFARKLNPKKIQKYIVHVNKLTIQKECDDKKQS